MINKSRKNHGLSKTRLYIVWKGMKSRCYNPNHQEYKNYGGRGIKICDDWKNDFLSFRTFAIEQGYDERAPRGKHTIERINVDGDYEPSNCKIVSFSEQMNNRTNSRKYLYKGEYKTLSQLSEEHNIDRSTVEVRLKYGYSLEDALIKPVKKRKNNLKCPKYTILEKTHTFREWAEILGISRDKLKSRTRHKTLEDIVIEFFKDKD